MAAQYTNAYDFKQFEVKNRKKYVVTSLSTYSYPLFGVGYLPAAIKYSATVDATHPATTRGTAMPEHCELVDRAAFVTAYKDKISAKAMAGMLTIMDKGWGCASCRPFVYPTAAEIAAGAAAITNPPFAYLDILGYASTPDHVAFRREDMYIARRCGAANALSIGSGKVAGK